MFQDKADVTSWMEFLQAGLSDGQTLQVSGQQNTQAPNLCITQATATYTVTAKIITRSCKQCNPAGESCFPDDGDPSYDCSADGDGQCDVHEYCCRNGPASFDGTWQTEPCSILLPTNP